MLSVPVFQWSKVYKVIYFNIPLNAWFRLKCKILYSVHSIQTMCLIKNIKNSLEIERRCVKEICRDGFYDGLKTFPSVWILESKYSVYYTLGRRKLGNLDRGKMLKSEYNSRMGNRRYSWNLLSKEFKKIKKNCQAEQIFEILFLSVYENQVAYLIFQVAYLVVKSVKIS